MLPEWSLEVDLLRRLLSVPCPDFAAEVVKVGL